MEDVTTIQKILDILLNQAVYNTALPSYNERYIHHMFSQACKNHFPISLTQENLFHPEWATMNQNRKNGGQYNYVKGEYIISDKNGRSGFIDFAIGNIDSPKIAIEFKVLNTFREKRIKCDPHFSNKVNCSIYYLEVSDSKYRRIKWNNKEGFVEDETYNR